MADPAQNNNWLNKTPNKTLRAAGQTPKFIVYHETASPSPSNPVGTLNFNLDGNVASSYHYLIAQDGTIYNYIDPDKYIAWHTGTGKALGYTDWYMNVYSIGIEFDGNNLGPPITQAQTISGIWLVRMLCEKYHIPYDPAYHLRHSIIATPPGRKSDPRGYDPLKIMELASKSAAVQPVPTPAPSTDIQVIGVPQAITVDRAIEAFKARQAPLSEAEMHRIYDMCTWLEIDVRFFIAVAQHEAGLPLGGSPLQKLSNCPFNIRADGEGRFPYVIHPTRGDRWMAYESFQLGSFASILHLKNVYGKRGLYTVQQIIPVFAPSNDGNNVASYISSVLKNMVSM